MSVIKREGTFWDSVAEGRIKPDFESPQPIAMELRGMHTGGRPSVAVQFASAVDRDRAIEISLARGYHAWAEGELWCVYGCTPVVSA